MRKVRSLRHWKQRFNHNAKFIWRRPIIWQGETVEVGTPIPEDLVKGRAKLRRFWEAGVIELAEFEDPDVVTGQEPEPVKDPEPFDYAAEWPDTPETAAVQAKAQEDAGLDQEAWEALSDLERADLMQVAMGEMQEEPQEPEGQEPVTVEEGQKPEDLVTKETDRKWHVKGVDEVFKSKTLATAKAAELIAEAEAAESTEDDAWLDGDNPEE
ncbi:hypothetical protein [Roseobacter phage RDJL6]|nr:hypothetical protein [Roseobacter phage RDJL6]